MTKVGHDQDTLEEPLSGGNLTNVVRVGDTVRRSCGPWSPTIHHLLIHLETVQFAGAPHFLGIDAHGREIVSFLPAESDACSQLPHNAAHVADGGARSC